MDAPIKLANSPSKCLLTYLRTCLISENLSPVLKLNFQFSEVLKYLLLKYPLTSTPPHPHINSTTHHDRVLFPSDYSLIRLIFLLISYLTDCMRASSSSAYLWMRAEQPVEQCSSQRLKENPYIEPSHVHRCMVL